MATTALRSYRTASRRSPSGTSRVEQGVGIAIPAFRPPPLRLTSYGGVYGLGEETAQDSLNRTVGTVVGTVAAAVLVAGVLTVFVIGGVAYWWTRR